MRIISGKYRGKQLKAPTKLLVRPTTDMAKEALFNILNNKFYFNQINVIDLFAGIGSISFEFASRGTKNIISVDQNFGCIKYINSIIKELELPINTIKSDVYTYLNKTRANADVIFADPPYNFETNQFIEIANLVFNKNLLNEEGILIIEHSSHTDLSEHKNFSYFKRYGGTVFSFFE